MAEEYLPFHKELSGLAFFVSLPQLIASPIVVGLQHVIYHDVAAFEIKEVLDFLLISFPLTLCVAALVVIIKRGWLNPFSLLLAVFGAALLSNLLHAIIKDIPFIGFQNTVTETAANPQYAGSSNLIFILIGKIFGIYWKTFGPILFIQSCCIGIFAGYRFLEKKKKDTKKK